ncbi:MAG: helix-turn-helix transcriptional regulator [Clostridia bacterium]|nr:helix-turn-helix transcriptional regulator [Clostridia bacterium]
MSIGSNIKSLRRAADLTQERLAELLHISASAVSQWETDRVLPDVTQIPLLANIFGVSADVILGIDPERDREKIEEILARSREARDRVELSKRTSILREGLREHPRSYRLMYELANAIVCEYSRKGIKEYGEVFDLCKRILAECTDSTVRLQALDILGVAYDYAGMKKEMLEVAEQMPPMRYTKETFMLWRWEDNEEGLRKLQEFFGNTLSDLDQTLWLISTRRNEEGQFVYPIEERTGLWELRVRLVELFFPDGDYYGNAQNAEIACGFLASAALTKGDKESAIRWLQKACDYAIHFDTYDFEASHTSPVLRGYCGGGWLMEREGNDSAQMLHYLLHDKETAPIRDDPRIQELIGRVRQTAYVPRAEE